jgi:hypothetical protein
MRQKVHFLLAVGIWTHTSPPDPLAVSGFSPSFAINGHGRVWQRARGEGGGRLLVPSQEGPSLWSAAYSLLCDLGQAVHPLRTLVSLWQPACLRPFSCVLPVDWELAFLLGTKNGRLGCSNLCYRSVGLKLPGSLALGGVCTGRLGPGRSHILLERLCCFPGCQILLQ